MPSRCAAIPQGCVVQIYIAHQCLPSLIPLQPAFRSFVIWGFVFKQVAQLVHAFQQAGLAERVDREPGLESIRQTAPSALPGRSSPLPASQPATRLVRYLWVPSSTTTGSRPFFKALLRKISANDVLMTARMPQPNSAQGACSRDEPQPKLSPASRTWQSWYSSHG